MTTENFLRGVKSGLIHAHQHNQDLDIVGIFREAYSLKTSDVDQDTIQSLIKDMEEYLEMCGD